MKISITAFLFILISFGFLSNKPVKSSLENNLRRSVEYTVMDDSVEYALNQVLDQNGSPIFYYCDIEQFPCHSKNVCLMLKVRVYWDIMGNYLIYELMDDEVLTKLNHKEFSEKDYKKLHKILNSPSSALQYCKYDNLTYNEAENDYHSVDVVSSATAKNLDFEYIGGAVKTTYTLWKIVNGNPTEEIKKITGLFFQKNGTNTLANISHIGLNKKMAEASNSDKLAMLYKLWYAGQPLPEDFLQQVVSNLSVANTTEFQLLMEILQAQHRSNKKEQELVSLHLNDKHYLRYIQAYNYLQKTKSNKYIKKLDVKFRDINF